MQKLADVPETAETFLCDHCFADLSKTAFIAMNADHSFSVGCGCDFTSARLIGFGHVQSHFPELSDLAMLKPLSHYDRIDDRWEYGEADEVESS